jgi:hypothetical protein
MSSSNLCLSGLIGKRAELAGEIRLLEKRLEQLRSNILHVDAIVSKVRRPRCDGFRWSELIRSLTTDERCETDSLRCVLKFVSDGLKGSELVRQAGGRDPLRAGKCVQADRGAPRAAPRP